MNGEETKTTTFSEDWYDFCQDFSMNGVRFVFMRNISIVRRLIWLVLLLSCLVYFSYAAFGFLDDFIKYKVNTKVRVESADELRFPTITVCNRNLWTLEAMNFAAAAFGSEIIFDIMKDMYDMSRPSPPPVDKYNWSLPKYKVITYLDKPSDLDNFLIAAAHPLNYSLSGCSVTGVSYECKDLFEVVTTDGGYCFQLNSNASLRATAAGRTGGIYFQLNALVDQYTTGPYSASEGFMISFQDSHETPLIKDLSVGLEPGIQADIMLQKTTTNRKPPPADDNRSNCFDTEELKNPLHHYKNYSYSACLSECITNYVIKNCGCKDAFQPAINGTQTCLFKDMLFCSTPSIRKFPSDPEGLLSCKCKDACKVSEYTPKITTTKFPSTNFAREFGFDEVARKYIADNMLLVNIYYGKMSYQRTDEEFAYSAFDMISNLGGTLGLCVGASVLTLCELAEFGIRMAGKLFSARRNKNSVSSIQVRAAPS